MVDLHEARQRVLSELEETHERDIVPLINIVFDRAGTSDEVDALRDCLRSLLQDRHIDLALQTFFPRGLNELGTAEANALIDDLAEWLEFGRHGDYWHYRGIDMAKEPYPTVLATEKGLAAARDVLSRRGYQWWRPKSR